jgi:peptidoglycan/xylan/chitin deacetylase (PgdA/CDA1 family)
MAILGNEPFVGDARVTNERDRAVVVRDERNDEAPSEAPRSVTRRGLILSGVAAAAALGASTDRTIRRLNEPSGPNNQRFAATGHVSTARLTDTRVRWRADIEGRRVALTFDDGPDPAWTPHVLEVLDAYSARATFFQLGKAALRYPDLVAACAEHGEVGNHTFDHPDLATLSPEAVGGQLRRTHEILTSCLARPPSLFRPPYGNISGPVLEASADLGYETTLWTEHIQGARTTIDDDVDRLMTRLRPGMIVLAHDGRQNRQGVLDRLGPLLRRLTDEGYACVTVGELDQDAKT